VKDIQKQVGARIRELRVAKGLSQEDLAASCNLHRTYVGLIERGQRNLTLGTVETIAGALGVSVSYLFAPLSGPARAVKREGITVSELPDHIRAIQQILIEAGLTDEKRYAALLKTHHRRSR
jgi:transcriptional regulator with XRE-family HTH domain